MHLDNCQKKNLRKSQFILSHPKQVTILRHQCLIILDQHFTYIKLNMISDNDIEVQLPCILICWIYKAVIKLNTKDIPTSSISTTPPPLVLTYSELLNAALQCIIRSSACTVQFKENITILFFFQLKLYKLPSWVCSITSES
jgi:hypothetical protein